MKSNDAGAKIIDRRKNWEARVEMAVFKRPQSELSAYDKLVYAILCGHANRDGNAMLYVRTIAEEASCSERQAQRAMSNLETRGLLVRRAQNQNGRQTFNIYEVYGFDAYISGESAPEAESGNGSAGDDSGVTDSHRRQTVTPPPSDSPPRGDSQSGLNNVFEQPLFNSSKDNNFPPTPQGGNPQEQEGREKNSESLKPQKPEHDTEEKEELSKSNREMELFEVIREAYNSTLPELPRAEKLTASRSKALRQRIRESPERKEPDWWKKFFSSVREFPWPMGRNRDKWRADFDWLIGERGMQKILEGAFQKAQAVDECAIDSREFQKKYTDSEGRIDARAMLRDIQRTSAHRQFFS
jgi:hypothetical protein